MKPAARTCPAWIDAYTEDLAREILELQDCVRDVEAERDAYRELLRLALNTLRQLTVTCDRLREQNRDHRRSLPENAGEDRRAA